MSKGKSGKKAPVTTETAQAVAQAVETTNSAPAAAPESAKSDEKDVNIRIRVTDKSVRENTRKDGSTFYGVTLPVAGFNGAPKDKVDFVSIAVNKNQYSQAANPVYDKNEDGTKSLRRDANGKVVTTPVEGYANIWLYKESRDIKVNYPTDQKTEDGKRVYAETTVKAGDLRDMNEAARKQYKAAKDAEKSTDKAAEAVAAAPAQVVEADDQIDLDD